VVSEKQENGFELPKRTFTVEFLVGLFALVGLLSFGYLSINIAGLDILESGYYEVGAEFDNISGLEVGASVEIAGVPVGEVTNVALRNSLAFVTFKVQEKVKLHDDDIAVIRTKGIIGERYLKILPGASEELIERGGQIADTESVVDFEEIVGKLIHRLE
jgi:phospholipid/cholesterol/gamma-HCH transport system substrate-binding protein